MLLTGSPSPLRSSSPSLLTQSPVLMAHDASTAYAEVVKGTISGTDCYQFKTQAFAAHAPFMGKAGHMPSGLTSLLDCGARALDLRLTKGGPCANKGIGEVCMHHSILHIEHQSFESELQTVVNWTTRYPSELVLLKLVPDNDGAPEAIQAALAVHNITSVPKCVGHGVDPDTWTLEQARTRARIPSGGLLLATWAPSLPDGQPSKQSCVDDNFVRSIAFDPADAASSFEALWRYANETVQRQRRTAKFQELQLIWQSARTFELYAKAYPWHALDLQPFKYGNLESTQDSSINSQVLARIGGMQGPSLNLVKLNDICLHGLEIAKSLGTNVTTAQEASCAAACGGINSRNTCLKSTERSREKHDT